MCVYVHTYIYMYTYTHIYIYVYILCIYLIHVYMYTQTITVCIHIFCTSCTCILCVHIILCIYLAHYRHFQILFINMYMLIFTRQYNHAAFQISSARALFLSHVHSLALVYMLSLFRSSLRSFSAL